MVRFSFLFEPGANEERSKRRSRTPLRGGQSPLWPRILCRSLLQHRHPAPPPRVSISQVAVATGRLHSWPAFARVQGLPPHGAPTQPPVQAQLRVRRSLLPSSSVLTSLAWACAFSYSFVVTAVYSLRSPLFSPSGYLCVPQLQTSSVP